LNRDQPIKPGQILTGTIVDMNDDVVIVSVGPASLEVGEGLTAIVAPAVPRAVDLIAERIRALGFPAPGSYREFAELSSVEDAAGRPLATEMIAHLAKDQEKVVRTARRVFTLADDAHDEPTADLLTQRMQVHEKTAWMLRAMLAG